MQIRRTTAADQGWMRAWISARWGAETVAVHGETIIPHLLAGFVAEDGDRRVGLVTYRIAGGACEIVTLDADPAGQGTGSLLVEAVRHTACEAGCARLWLITTNDNLDALRFYQRRGFRLVRVHVDVVTEARRIKPQIPLVGAYGIPLRDELELEMRLDG